MKADVDEKIAVDFDGVLVECIPYDVDYIPDKFGEPIPMMIERVKRWLAEGKEIVIFTARVHPSNPEEAEIARSAIQRFCLNTFGMILEVTCMKSPKITRFYDDLAVTVEKDTGRILTPGFDKEEKDVPDALGSFLSE